MEHIGKLTTTLLDSIPTPRESRRNERRGFGRVKTMRERIGLAGTAVTKTFDSFKADAQPEAYAAAKAFMDKPESLLFHGPNGIGKTHLAVAIGNAHLEKYGELSISPSGEVGSTVLFITFDDALRKLRRTYKDGYDGFGEDYYIDRWRTIPVLILDEVGMAGRHKASEFTRRIGYDLVDGRYRLGGKPIILTSNKTPGQLGEWITESAVSRLFEMGQVIEMKGRDWRRK